MFIFQWLDIPVFMQLKYFIFFVMSLVMTHSLYAGEEEQWFRGTLILKSQTRLQGEISIRVDYDIVLFRMGDELMIYPAHKVHSANVYDESLKLNRNFISLQMEVGAASVHKLYEVLVEGPVSMLRKQRLLWYSIHLDIPEQDYYIWNENEMTSLYFFKKKKFPKLVKASDGDLKSFIRSQRLNPNRLEDMVEILKYYNKQQFSENQLAKRE
jgi:hypothetical protein